jgi:hypothetical protein
MPSGGMVIDSSGVVTHQHDRSDRHQECDGDAESNREPGGSVRPPRAPGSDGHGSRLPFGAIHLERLGLF